MIYVITLNPRELRYAQFVGRVRQDEAEKKGSADSHGYDGKNGLEVHITGACGEIAVAKMLGWYWKNSVNTYKSGGDVGPLQVRTSQKMTKSGRHSCLIVRPDDDDTNVFVHVWMQDLNHYEIAGYIKGNEAKQAQWWWANPTNERPPAHFVPYTALHDAKELTQLFSPPTCFEEQSL